jgi:hypothetical protein
MAFNESFGTLFQILPLIDLARHPSPSSQKVNQEVDDMYAEFQREKEDLLESIRMLQDQMQLKDMVIEAFIPPEETQKVRQPMSDVKGVRLD